MPTSKVILVNNFIQTYLRDKGITTITPVEIARELESAGILKDSKSRPGLPLRNLLRQGSIENSWQDDSNRWHIDRIAEHAKKYSISQVSKICGYKTVQSIYNKINEHTIPFEKDKKGEIYFLKERIDEWLKENMKVPATKPKLSKLDMVSHIETLENFYDLQETNMQSVISLIKSTSKNTDDQNLQGKLDLIISLIVSDLNTWHSRMEEIISNIKQSTENK
tara:strand:- start:100 stop:765 length:666 start_codon:yes stop_codon:yes gene_type:complete